ncbi:MAG: NAD-dependent deacetylase [Rhodobiaceae bacterium]|nr:NAD-dependent deacetylase [Rhodobiaceae bacterium]MCC0047935.1 NAD-dependent deacetylase [Rhodobiaceae bacterium]
MRIRNSGRLPVQAEEGGRELAALLDAAARIVVFTGAGASTDCGIPDFRSPTGIWKTNMPIPYQDFVADPQARKEAWRRKFAIQPSFETAEKSGVLESRSHRAIHALHKTGRVSAVITQNIDNLHQASGIPPEKIIELHGNGSYAVCLSCDRRHELEFIREAFESNGAPPDCLACGGILKTATISFGQAMPQEEMLRARAETLSCDLFLVLGSSLVVHPAATLPVIAAQNGAGLVIVNNEETPLDPMASLVVRADIGDAFSQWMRARGAMTQ